MSLKDLKELGVLLAEEEWGAHDLHTTVNKPALLMTIGLGAAAVVGMYLGGGRTLTFVAAGMFLAFMVLITHISLAAIDAQADRFAQEREQLHEEAGPATSEAGGPNEGPAAAD